MNISIKSTLNLLLMFLFLFCHSYAKADTPPVSKPFVPESSKTAVINLYAPEGLIPVHLLSRFSTETNIEIEYYHYPDSPRTEDIESLNIDIAILKFSELAGNQALLATIQNIDYSQMPREKYLNLEMMSKLNDYSADAAPLAIEGTGIVTNSQMLPAEMFSSWLDLFDPQWTRQVLVSKDAHALLGIALLELGYPSNNASGKQLKEAAGWLEQFSTNIAYFSDSDPEMDFLSGRVSLGVLTNHDAYVGNIEGGNMKMVWPREGAFLDAYGASLRKNSTKSEQCYQLINFLLEPYSQLGIAEESGLTPSTIDQSYYGNQSLNYVPRPVIAAGHFKLNSPSAREEYERVFNELVSQLELK